ncbi:MAG: metallophosphoesterase [Bacillota bacterium]|nr:metallophosphoesterase [Bacillota bacterium]
MALYAISDLHLALSTSKPMDIFGGNWYMHHEKIRENWLAVVREEDTVLIGGDISWSMKMAEGEKELQWIHELPGKKLIIKGNHDYWWGSITKLNKMFEDMNFIQNNHFNYEEYGICGTRGWICPGSERFEDEDLKIYKRELIRLRLSLDSARKAGFERLIAMIHYPPTNEKFEDSGFTDIFKEYEVEKVIYGHLHGPFHYRVLNGEREGIHYIMTSSDYINFNPVLLL